MEDCEMDKLWEMKMKCEYPVHINKRLFVFVEMKKIGYCISESSYIIMAV